jgi:Uma2 family endonuclease
MEVKTTTRKFKVSEFYKLAEAGILSENDQRSKIPVYAAARIKEVWIVDLIGNCIHTYRRPGTSSRAYAEFFSFDRATWVSPHTFPDIRICCLC